MQVGNLGLGRVGQEVSVGDLGLCRAGQGQSSQARNLKYGGVSYDTVGVTATMQTLYDSFKFILVEYCS